jgi:hypothetical protein
MGKLLPHPFTLSELVKEVRKELLIIRDDKSMRDDPLMVLKKLEMELQVDVAADLNGGLKFGIFNFGSKLAGKNAHVIKLAFEPYTSPAPQDGGGGGAALAGKEIPTQPLKPTEIVIKTDTTKLPSGTAGMSFQ